MKNELDWDSLATELTAQTKAAAQYDAGVHGHLFRKIAFDVYEKIGETGLWELQERDNGDKVLVALYGDELDTIKTASVWSALPDSSCTNVTLFCGGMPFYKFESAQFFKKAEAGQFASFVAGKANEPEFVNKLLEQMPANRRSMAETILAKTLGQKSE